MTPPRVTLKQIAEACGLSLSTVSAALNHSDGRYNAETVRHVREVASRLGYRVNQQAKILRGAPSGLIGIVKNISLHEVVTEFSVHAGEAIYEAGYRFFSSDISHEILTGSGGLSRSLEIMQDARVEGILIVSCTYNEKWEETISTVVRGKTPVVLIDGYPYDGIPYVGTDYYKGFSQLVRHFVNRGYRSIALAMSREDLASVNEHFTTKGAANWRVNEAVRAISNIARRQGIKMSLMAMPCDVDPSDLESIYFKPAEDFIHEVTRDGDGPRAIIFINDLFAMAALRACHDLGLKVPENVAVASCDGSAIAHYTVPRLTTLEVPAADVARKAVSLLTSLIRRKHPAGKESRILLPPKLRIRESCGGRPERRIGRSTSISIRQSEQITL